MAAPKTAMPTLMLEREGPEAVLRFIGQCGGVVKAALQTNTNKSSWQDAASRAAAMTGRGWRDYLGGGDERPVIEPAQSEGPTVIVKRPAKEDAFDPDEVDAEIDKGDAQAYASVPISDETRESVEQTMGAKEDEDDERVSKVPKLWMQESIPRRQTGRLIVPDAIKPQDDADPISWFEYLTTISEFREMVPEVRLRVAKDRAYAAYIPVSDIHAGKQGCRFAKVRALLEWGRNRPGYYFGGIGDWANCPTISSPEADQLGKQVCTVGAATAALYWLWKPIADAGALLGIHDGNHEYRIAKATGQDDISPMRYLAERLNVPYWGYETPLIVRVGEQQYGLYQNHGTGGGQTLGYILATLERMSWNNEADAIIMGHRHMKIAVERAKYAAQEVDIGFEWQAKFRWLICTGCMCESVASEWSRQKNMPPATSGTVTLRLYADKKDIHARA